MAVPNSLHERLRSDFLTHELDDSKPFVFSNFSFSRAYASGVNPNLFAIAASEAVIRTCLEELVDRVAGATTVLILRAGFSDSDPVVLSLIHISEPTRPY